MVELNWAESLAMGSPLRRLALHHVEAPVLFGLMDRRRPVERALELGCGPGYGAEAILRRFPHVRLIATDLDPGMVGRARRHFEARPELAGRVGFQVQDAARLTLPSGGFDAVFEFGILHHVPPWRRALREVRRVLRPGGLFVFEDLQGDLVRALPWFSHPPEANFTAGEFRGAVEEAGLRSLRFHALGRWALLGVAERPAKKSRGA